MTLALATRDLVHERRLCVAREDIDFHNVTPERVRIEITVHNFATRRSQPTPLHLQSAPLGAFVPWQPLHTLTVPPIAPGAAAMVHAEVPRRLASLMAQFSDHPPGSVLTAIGADDSEERPSARRSTEARGPVIRQRVGTGSTIGLAPDLLELLGRRNKHWVGNLNVFIGQRSVERHLARSLRVYPGKTNCAAFIVGSGPDAYSFELCGFPLCEYATLFADRGFFSPRVQDHPIAEHKWLECRRRLMVHVFLDLPHSCQGGSLDVHVIQRSTGHSAIVEFSMDAAAEGPGCFVV